MAIPKGIHELQHAAKTTSGMGEWGRMNFFSCFSARISQSSQWFAFLDNLSCRMSAWEVIREEGNGWLCAI